MLIELTLALALDAGAVQDRSPSVQEPDTAAQQGEEPAFPERIVWFTQLDEALAEAERTNRPIFVNSASPSCSGAPGMW